MIRGVHEANMRRWLAVAQHSIPRPCYALACIPIRAPRADIRDEVGPVLAWAEAEEARSAADRLIAAVRAIERGLVPAPPD